MVDGGQKSETPEASLAKVKSKVDSSKSSKSLLSSASKRLSGSFRSKDDLVVEEKKPEKAITPPLSTKKTSSFTGQKTDTTAPKAPPSLPSPPIRKTSRKPDPQRETTTGSNNGETSEDEWERTVINEIKQWAKQEINEPNKIKQRYEKPKELIDSWEDKKKKKVKRQLMKQQSELEKERLKSLEKYVNLIADGARAKAEESRKKLQSELERGKKSLEKFQNKMKYVNIVADRARAKAEERSRLKNEKLQAKGKASRIPSAKLIDKLIDKYPGV